MALTLQAITRNASCAAECALAAGGKLLIRAGSTILANIDLPSPAFETAGTGSAGEARLIGGDATNPISSDNPVTFDGAANGNANNYQLRSAADALLWAGTVTATGDGGDMTLDTTAIVLDQTGALTAFTHIVPATPE